MIATERLVLLALDELEGSEAEAVEEHVLACGACASRFERLLKLSRVLPDLVRSGEVSFPVTTSLAAELEAAGLVSRSYRLAPERVVPCSVGATDIYALTTLEAKLDDVTHLDILITMSGGEVRLGDVPFDRERGLVGYVTPSSQLRRLPSGRVTIDLLAVAPGREQRIGRYFLDHTAPA